MLPKKSRRQDPVTLIWEYLDGEISPTRIDRLSTMLSERSEVRDLMVDSAALNGMLHAYFKEEAREKEVLAQARKARRQSGRSSAA